MLADAIVGRLFLSGYGKTTRSMVPTTFNRLNQYSTVIL